MSTATTEPLYPSKLTRYQLPGFGLPLNFIPHDEYDTYDLDVNTGELTTVRHPAQGDCGPLYPNALDCVASRRGLIPLREFTMMQLMNKITDKPNWNIKIFDEEITAKWKAEALSVPDIDITERMISWCIDELQYKAKEFEKTGIVTAYDGGIAKSDISIPSWLRDALRAAAAPLEDVPEVHRDWHPGSNDTVLDLVHPSLFPVVYGRTRILPDSTVGLDDCVKRRGDGVILGVPPSEEAQQKKLGSWGTRHEEQDPYSRKYQWLPCDIDFKSGRVKISSYINNLHPKVHRPLYDVIEQIIDLAIPLWDKTFSALTSSSAGVARINYTRCEYNPDPESWPEEEKPPQLPDETEYDYSERIEEWEYDTRRVVRPEPGEFASEKFEGGDRIKVDLKEEFAERGLQIIVKLANIHLTPEKPEYAGGTWHVEGQMNEHICATALYYYDSANITDSHIAFRQQSSDPHEHDIFYQQNHFDWLMDVFGGEQQGPAVQYVGDVVTREGRLLTFPNVFQHRVLPFKLLNSTQPGHRKILALFLVDPHIRVISSANVPCQQREWYEQEILGQRQFQTLPAEMQNRVVSNVAEFPISIEEAKEIRLELMEERKVFVRRHDQKFEREVFALCEH